MTHEEIVDFILYGRLQPIISSIDRFNFEDGNIKVIEQLRQIYVVWIDETKESIFCQDYLSDNTDNSLNQCETMLLALIGKSIIHRCVNKYSFEELLEQMRICMLKDKYNPFFKLKIVEQKKIEIEQDFK